MISAIRTTVCEALDAAVWRGPGQATPRGVLAHVPLADGSTFPIEVVTYRGEDGSCHRLVCKHGPRQADRIHGHKGGVPYEAQVYSTVLNSLALPKAAFYGSYDGPDGVSWLFLEHLADCLRVSMGPDPQAVLAAARWAGLFHASHESMPLGAARHVLNEYDADYYAGWARRTRTFTAPIRDTHPWIARLCENFERHSIDRLLAAPKTVIHGEYTPHNVLFRNGQAYPIDWESAAIGVGEIDLASLVDGWGAPAAMRCHQEYCQSRWGRSTGGEADQLFLTACVYMHLRWLGDRPKWAVLPDRAWRFTELESLGQRLGLI